MALDQRFLDELIYRSDIVDICSSYVSLKKAGANYVALCPFHNEKTPSFSVSREKQLFKCFGCGEGGNVISFVMKIENLPFIEAVKLLAEKAGLTLPDDGWEADGGRALREKVLDINRNAAVFYHQTLMSPKGAAAREYLEKRGVSQEAIKMFGLGYAPDSWDSLLNAMVKKGFTKADLEAARLISAGKGGGFYDFFRDRIIFPINDLRRNVLAFGGRVIAGDGGGRKYINSPDTPVYNKSRVLYGMNLAKNTKAEYFILVEGNLDVIALHQAGFDSAVASCGTAFTLDQAKLLSRYKNQVVICYDYDEAGKKATQKAIEILKQAGVAVRVITIPPKRDETGRLLLDEKGNPIKNDPDDYIKANGRQAFAAVLEKVESDSQYKMGLIRGKYTLESDEERIEYSKEAVRYIASIQSGVEREIIAHRAARDAGISFESMMGEINRTRAQNQKKQARQIQKDGASPRRAVMPQSREIRYKNPASAKSEELLLKAVLSRPELLEYAKELIDHSEFSNDFLGRIFKIAVEKHESGLDATAATVMIRLSEQENAHLASILAGGLTVVDGKEQVADYIEKIKTENARGDTSDDTLMLLLKKKQKEL